MTGALTTSTRYEWNAGSVRALRRFLGLSQSLFAAELGVRQQTVSEWETGMYRPRGASATLLTMIAMRAGFIHDLHDAPPEASPVAATASQITRPVVVSSPLGVTSSPPAGVIGAANARLQATPRPLIGRPEVAI
ncbi:MAG: helix-turn-helix domain-containing protein [Chloroflexi bacterium]|nr:helix-turn-helix domain-containing protein [Chloroflexota bacterium]